MSSPCRSAAGTIGSCTGTATRRTGGRTCKWRRSRSRRSFGTSALSMLPQQRLATKVCDRGGCYPGWCRWHLRQGAVARNGWRRSEPFFRFRSARPIWCGCWHVGRMGYSSPCSSKARSAQTHSAPHAEWDWRAWYRSIATARMKIAALDQVQVSAEVTWRDLPPISSFKFHHVESAIVVHAAAIPLLLNSGSQVRALVRPPTRKPNRIRI